METARIPSEVIVPGLALLRKVVVGGVGKPLEIDDDRILRPVQSTEPPIILDPFCQLPSCKGKAAGTKRLQGLLDVGPIFPAPSRSQETKGMPMKSTRARRKSLPEFTCKHLQASASKKHRRDWWSTYQRQVVPASSVGCFGAQSSQTKPTRTVPERRSFEQRGSRHKIYLEVSREKP